MNSPNARRNRTPEGSSPAPDRLFFLNNNERARIRRALLLLGGETAIGPRSAPTAPDRRTLEKVTGLFLKSGSRVTLSEILQMAPDGLSAVARLLDALALGPVAVEWWLDDYAPKKMYRRSGPSRASRAASG